jgi:hypothetical protein
MFAPINATCFNGLENNPWKIDVGSLHSDLFAQELLNPVKQNVQKPIKPVALQDLSMHESHQPQVRPSDNYLVSETYTAGAKKRDGVIGNVRRRRQGPRWWTCAEEPLLCPLTQFPIAKLPYPPFNLRVGAKSSPGGCLVDGKFLALMLIASGTMSVLGKELEPSDIIALDRHIQRCKLGPFRPTRVATLQRGVIAAAGHADEKNKAMQELKELQTQARVAMKRLRRIQENRLRWTTKDEQQQSGTPLPRSHGPNGFDSTRMAPPSPPISPASTIGSDSENDGIRFFHL